VLTLAGMAGPIDKKSLLAWLQALTGRPVTRFEDLRDGQVLLRACERVLPKTFDIAKRRRGVNNWETLKLCLEDSGIPSELCDTKAIAVRHSYNFRS
jgi:hypothetical protein